MAKPIDLDPDGYGGTYKLIGGAPALDFANLVSYRGLAREHDWLSPPVNARRWAVAAGLPTPGRSESAELAGLRELIARLFLAVVDGCEPDQADVTELGDIAAAAFGGRVLRFRDGSAQWADPAGSLTGALALDAARLLTDPALLSLIRTCPGCRWLFLDTTRNHRRSWCDPADCGNRARQRRHYERTRTS